MKTQTKDGGPAFPFTRTEIRDGKLGHDVMCPGISTRDFFAAMALAGLRLGDWADCRDGAKYCYDYADAMLAQRAVEMTSEETCTTFQDTNPNPL